jgi:translation elongation factor EF-1alpha
MLHSYTSKSPAKIAQLISIVDQKTGNVTKEHPKALKPGMFAVVKVSLVERLCLELFKNFQNLGRVVLRHENHTIAAGQITEMLS